MKIKELLINPFLIERITENHIGNKQFLFNTKLRFMTFNKYFEAAVTDNINIIYLIFEKKSILITSFVYLLRN